MFCGSIMSERLSVDHVAAADIFRSNSRCEKHHADSINAIENRDDQDVESSPVDHSQDVKKKQKFDGLLLIWLAYQSTGVIYGDIGTSPLYVYSSTFRDPPSYDDLLGALSLIIWSLTIVVCIKYVGIVLCADDEGEGGTFALYSLISRYVNIVRGDPRSPGMAKMERHQTEDMRKANTKFRRLLETNCALRNLVKILAVCGVALVIADGILTPAQSVLGAVQGLNVVLPNITTSAIVGISCAFLVVLFAIQPFGTAKIGSTFAPIVILWLLFNFAFGIYNLVQYDHTVLKAFSPYFAVQWFSRKRRGGWEALGGIVLAFTGVEALFADMGAFSARAIRLSWVFAYPCLLLAYIGQAAYISVNPAAVSNPFFETVPPGMFYPSLILSILAAFVASQAMITGAFQLLSQTVQMSYFPNVRTVHTSTKFFGQIYIPIVNVLMFVGTILVTVVYNNTTNLGDAYGVCVVMVTAITTTLVAVTAIVVWRLHFLLVIPSFLIFATIDGLFLSASLTKVPHGAWFTILVAGVLSGVLLLWRYGKNEQWKAESSDPYLIPPARLVSIDSNGSYQLTMPESEPRELRILKGLGVFFDKAGKVTTAPPVFAHFLHKFEALHEISIFFHLRQTFAPHVADDQRYMISRVIGLPNTFRVTVRHGYTENVFTSAGDDGFNTVLMAQLKSFLEKSTPTATADHDKFSTTFNTNQNIARILSEAAKGQMVYIFGKEELIPREGGNWARGMLLGTYCWMRDNCRRDRKSVV